MHSSQEISSSNPLLSTQSSTEISQDLKEQFYQSFLAMDEEGMTQLIKAHGLKVVYSDFDYSDKYIKDIKITHTDPISRMAFVCNKQERFSFESCQFFLKLLDHKQRIEIIESINLCAFLDDNSSNKKSPEDIHFTELFLKMTKAEYSTTPAENDDFKECIKRKILSKYLDKENLNSQNPLYGGQYSGIGGEEGALFLLNQLHYLLESEDIAKILTAYDNTCSRNKFFINEIFGEILSHYDAYPLLCPELYIRHNSLDSIFHLFAKDHSYFDSDQKKIEMHQLIRNIYCDIDKLFLNRNTNPYPELPKYKSVIDFVNEVSLESKTPIQIAIENLNINFLSIFVSVVEYKCLEEYNALLQKQTLTIDSNYDQNLFDFFQKKALEAIKEIEKIKFELTPTNPKEETLKEFEIGNQIYGLMRLALLTNNEEIQIAIINNIIDIIEQQQLIFTKNNISKEDIFEKICLKYFNKINGICCISYEEVLSDEYLEIESYKVGLREEDHHERLIKMIEDAHESRVAYLGQNQKYQEAAIYFYKEIPKILKENIDHFSHEFAKDLTEKDSKEGGIDPEFLPFAMVIHDIFHNFEDLEKGKEVFKKSLKEFAAGKEHAFAVSMIMLGGVIDKVANIIKESRKPNQDNVSESLHGNEVQESTTQADPSIEMALSPPIKQHVITKQGLQDSDDQKQERIVELERQNTQQQERIVELERQNTQQQEKIAELERIISQFDGKRNREDFTSIIAEDGGEKATKHRKTESLDREALPYSAPSANQGQKLSDRVRIENLIDR